MLLLCLLTSEGKKSRSRPKRQRFIIMHRLGPHYIKAVKAGARLFDYFQELSFSLLKFNGIGKKRSPGALKQKIGLFL